MRAASAPGETSAKLLVVCAGGAMQVLPRRGLASLFRRGDLVVANDAATLPASLAGVHEGSGRPIEVRLAGWVSARDPTLFDVIVFGGGDHRTRTEERAPPPVLAPGDRLSLGTLGAVIESVSDPAGLFRIRFFGERAAILADLARNGRPIQYAHVPEPLCLWDVWTAIAADPVAFEAPSAGFALDWRVLQARRQRGVGFATLTLAAGLSSTGRPALDAKLPLDEPFHIPEATAAAIRESQSRGGRIIAVGTTVVRALEAGTAAQTIRAGDGIARGRIGRGTLRSGLDAILTGVHQPGESHFELLRAFVSDRVLDRMSKALEEHDFRTHEFGDSVLIERDREREPPP